MTASRTKPSTTATDRAPVDDAAFARNGYTSPFGKLDARVESFRVESDVLDEFSRKAASLGKGVAELLRDLMRISAYGREEVLKVHRIEVEKVARMLDGEAQEQ